MVYKTDLNRTITMFILPLLLPVLFVSLHGCSPTKSEVTQQQQEGEMRVSAPVIDDKTKEEYTAKSKRLDVASFATVPVAPLTSQEALDEYSSRLADLQFLILSAEKDPLIQSPRSHWQLYVDSSLNRAREALASGMITKGKAQLGMKDFDGARKTLRLVLVTFDPKVYGHLIRQAESSLQDVEKAADLAKAEGNQ
jgi:hypothetical protein